MIQTKPITPVSPDAFAQMGWDFLIAPEISPYLVPALVPVPDAAREAFYKAGNQMYELLADAAEHHIKNKTLDALGIPANLHRMIYHTWENDNHLHLFGRFDFAGGLDNTPIKLMEFNADTPTSLPETAIVQWAQLKVNDIPETQQFNFVYEALVDNFKRLADLNPKKERAMLFSTMREAAEDDQNVAVMRSAAEEAGFETEFCYIEDVIFSPESGIYAPGKEGQPLQYPFWFKLVPWEFIAIDEPELADLLTEIVIKEYCVVINPAYALVLQSKALLATLHKLNAYHPLILPAHMEAPLGRPLYPFVRKVILGREGANVAIFDRNGLPEEVTGGDYEDQMAVYQEKATLNTDSEGYYYQAGVFFAWEACGLGFRRAKTAILDDKAQFIGHFIEQ